MKPLIFAKSAKKVSTKRMRVTAANGIWPTSGAKTNQVFTRVPPDKVKLALELPELESLKRNKKP
jgi:hypothetical protein